MAVRGASHVHQCGGDHQTPATKTVHLVSLEKPTTVAGPHHDPRYSATERCWRQSGGDWGIFRAGRGSEARRDGTVSEAYTSCTIIPWPREPVCNYYSAWDGGRAPDTVSSPPLAGRSRPHAPVQPSVLTAPRSSDTVPGIHTPFSCSVSVQSATQDSI
jgi:hypothetical protein